MLEKDSKLYKEYVKYLKETYNITPEDTFSGINAIDELKSMRDEIMGVYGETEFVKFLDEFGILEEHRKKQEKFAIITFEEYKKSKLC